MNRHHEKLSHCVVLAIAFTLFPGMAFADDITTSINEALEYYNNGEYTEAVSSLNYASQLIQQKKGGSLESFLPKPLSGWSAEDASSQAAGAGMFGGVTAQREYRKGDSSVSVTIITDSPMLQGMMVMFSNPMFATQDGGKLEKINKQKAIVKYQPADKEGEIQIMVNSRFLVTVEGRGVTKEEMKQYAGAIDYDKLADLP